MIVLTKYVNSKKKTYQRPIPLPTQYILFRFITLTMQKNKFNQTDKICDRCVNNNKFLFLCYQICSAITCMTKDLLQIEILTDVHLGIQQNKKKTILQKLHTQ